jgi:hypothetical protein
MERGTGYAVKRAPKGISEPARILTSIIPLGPSLANSQACLDTAYQRRFRRQKQAMGIGAMSGATYANTSTRSAQLNIGMQLNPGERVLYQAQWSKIGPITGSVIFMGAPVVMDFGLLTSGQFKAFLILTAILALIFGLIYSAYKAKLVLVTNERIIFRRGIDGKDFALIPLDKIETVQVSNPNVKVRAGTVFNSINLSVAEPHKLAEAIERARSSLRY